LVTVVGHRGAAGLEPENTILSFKRALELGVDNVELDVHLTKDKELVVIHDSTVNRTTNGQGYVGNITLEAIKMFDAGKGEQVPTLQEIIDVVKGKAVLQIELKGLGVEESVVKTVEENKIIDDVILTSFRHYMVKRAKSLNQKMKTGVIFLCLPLDAPRMAIDAGANQLNANLNYIDEHLVEDAHRHGLKISAWTANEPEQMRRLLVLGVDAIVSDRPDILMEIVKKSTAV